MSNTTTRRLAPDRVVRQHAMWHELLAQETVEHRDLLLERKARAMSGSSSGSTDKVHTSLGSSTTETRALAAVHIQERLDRVAYLNERLGEIIREARQIIHRDMRGDHQDLPEPEQVIPCKHGQVGKAGAIEWGDPTCDFPPDKSAMCGRHYQAWRRFRIRNGIDTSKDFAA